MGLWTGSFTSLKGVKYTVWIGKSGISDKTLSLAPEPVTMKMSGSGRFDGMRSVELEIGVLTGDTMEELFGDDIFETAVAMTHRESVPQAEGQTRLVVDFVGFLEVSDWNMPCTPGRVEEKQLVAIDGLSAYGQKPYYERKAIKMVDHVDAILTDMNAKLAAAGITTTVTRQLTNNWSGWVSSEVLQPEDPYETKSSEGNWPSWADYVEEYAKGIFETVYMVGSVVKSQIQANAQTWIGADAAAETRLASNKMTMSMEPSRMKLKLEYDEARNLHDPEWVRPVYWGVNWSQVTHGPIEGRVAKLWYPQTGFTKYWVNGSAWDSLVEAGCVLRCASAVIGVTYGDTESQASSDAPTPMIGISAKSDPVTVLIPEATNAGTNTEVKLNAKVFINPTHVEGVPEYCCPLVWMRSAQEKTSGSAATFVMKYGSGNGTTVTASKVTVETSDSDDNWLDVTYVFTISANTLMANDFKVWFELRSPERKVNERGFHFAKDVQLGGTAYEEDDGDKTTVVTVNGKDTGAVLDPKIKMGFFTRLGMISGIYETSNAIINRLKAGYVSQYAVARKKWKMDVKDDGWSPEKKVWCRGTECTQLTAAWNPRYGKVTMTVVENG